ncbi:MAG: hypothetical protein KDI02_24875, partial [Anaerolineae bacterium]|nr:hypothetical protein [Anaerolineae bacterium]
GSVTLSYFEELTHSSLIQGTPYTMPNSITKGESPKNLGGFNVIFKPQNGGTISNETFYVNSDNPDVEIVFSDTETPITNADSVDRGKEST